MPKKFYEIDFCGLYCETLYDRNLRIFKPFQPILMFAANAGAYLSEASVR
jgi:hypothetical protein